MSCDPLAFVGAMHSDLPSPTTDRHLADRIIHCAGSATYQICFRLPIPNPNPKP